jgi:hypothetical protein
MVMAGIALMKDCCTTDDPADGKSRSAEKIISDLLKKLPRLPEPFYSGALLLRIHGYMAADSLDDIDRDVAHLRERDLAPDVSIRLRVAEGFSRFRRGELEEGKRLFEGISTSPFFKGLGLADQAMFFLQYGRLLRQEATLLRKATQLGAEAYAARLDDARSLLMKSLYLFAQSRHPEYVNRVAYYIADVLITRDTITGLNIKGLRPTVERWLKRALDLEEALPQSRAGAIERVDSRITEHPTKTVLRGRISAEYFPKRRWQHAKELFETALGEARRRRRLRLIVFCHNWLLEYLIRWYNVPPASSKGDKKEFALLAAKAYMEFERDLLLYAKKLPRMARMVHHFREITLTKHGSALTDAGVDLTALGRVAARAAVARDGTRAR